MEHLNKAEYPNKVKLGYFFSRNGGVDIYTEIDDVDSDWIDWEYCYKPQRIKVKDEHKQALVDIVNKDGAEGKYTNFKYAYQENEAYGFCLMTESFMEHNARIIREQKESCSISTKIIELFYSDKLLEHDRNYVINYINDYYKNGSSKN